MIILKGYFVSKLTNRKKSFPSDFCHFWKVIHKMPSVKIANLFEAFRPSFWRLAKHSMNAKMGIMSE